MTATTDFATDTLLDPLMPSALLPASETVVWQGKPGIALPRSRAEKALRIAGFAMLLCFAFFALIGWANRAEMDEAAGFLIAFLVLSGGGALFFLWGLPMVLRAGRRKTRYGVTDARAVITNGLGGRRLTLIRVADGFDVRIVPTSAKTPQFVTVIFGETTTRTRVKPDASSYATGYANIRRNLQFEGLSPEDARAAQAALLRIRGLDPGPVFEVQKL